MQIMYEDVGYIQADCFCRDFIPTNPQACMVLQIALSGLLSLNSRCARFYICYFTSASDLNGKPYGFPYWTYFQLQLCTNYQYISNVPSENAKSKWCWVRCTDITQHEFTAPLNVLSVASQLTLIYGIWITNVHIWNILFSYSYVLGIKQVTNSPKSKYSSDMQ